METAPRSETDLLLLAIVRKKQSLARLAATIQACADPGAALLYDQLALDEWKHTLILRGLVDGPADNWLAQLDLTPPVADPPDPLLQSAETVFGSAGEDAGQPQSLLGRPAEGVDREEVLTLLERLRADEKGHRTRLLSLLAGMGADRSVGATRLPAWPGSVPRTTPAAHLH